MKYSFRIILFLIAITFVFTACSERKDEYGVLLYPKEFDGPPAGAVVNIIGKRKTYNTWDKKTFISFSYENNTYECPQPFILFFDKTETAQQFAKKYSKYRFAFGRVTVNGLKLRDKPETYTEIKHRLSKNEMVKIIDRSKKMDEADGEKDYWYFVLTKDGERGYCFGHYLEIDEHDSWKKVAKKKQTEQETKENPFLNDILSVTWRPYYIYEQIKNGDIDPDVVKDDYGLFFDKDRKTITIKTPKIEFCTHYYKIRKKDYNSYVFWDSSVEVERINQQHINVTFKHNNNLIKQRYIKLPVSLNKILKEEKKRQKEAIKSFLEHSHRFISEAYGEITLSEKGTFFWETTDILHSNILPVTDSMKGEIDFTITLSDRLKQEFDGAFVLHDNNNDGIETTVYFLYRIKEEGLQLTYIPKNYVSQNRVLQKPLSPLVMFFKYININVPTEITNL